MTIPFLTHALRASAALALVLLATTCTGDHPLPTAPLANPPGIAADLIFEPPPPFCGDPTMVDLLQGPSNGAGTVTVGNTETHLYVIFAADPGWSLGKTALFVGDAAAQIPISGGGNPQPGKFPYRSSHAPGTDEAIWRVPLSVLTGETAVVAAFAEVPERGAWGDGEQINPRAGFATYFMHPLGECGEGEGGVEKTVGEEGDTVELEEIVELVIPPGALSEDTDITIDPAADAPGTIPGTTFDFGPDGTNFSLPAMLRICYDPADLPGGVDESLLRLVRVLPGDVEETENSGVDLVDHCVFGEVDHFSEFAAAEVLPPPPADPDYHVVVLGGDGSIQSALVTINPLTNAIVGITHQNLDEPFAIARIPGSDMALIGNRGDGTVVQCAWSSVFPWLPGCGLPPTGGFGDPISIAAYGDALVADHEGEQVLLFSNPGNSVAVSGPPTSVDVLPGIGKGYVAAGEFVDVITLGFPLVLESSIALAHHGAAVAGAPDGAFVYVAAVEMGFDPGAGEDVPVAGALYRINTATGAIDGAVHTMAGGEQLDPLSTIVVNAAGTTAYAAGMGRLYVLDLATWTISDVLEIVDWNEPQFMALSPDEGTLWATNRFTGQVMRLDLASETVTLINVGFGAGGGVLIIP